MDIIFSGKNEKASDIRTKKRKSKFLDPLSGNQEIFRKSFGRFDSD